MTLLPFNLPSGFVPLVKEDENVKEGQAIAETKVPSEVYINIANDLGIPIRKVRNAVKKTPGDKILEGDVLAEKKGIMGGKIIKSAISGTFARIDEETGSLVVTTGDGQGSGIDKILCPVDGTVSMVSEGKILVRTDKEAVVADRSNGEVYSGEVQKMKKNDVRDVDGSIAERVVVVDKISKEDLAKLLALGAGAVVASDIDDEVFANLSSKGIQTPVLRVKEKDMETVLKNAKKILVDGEKGVVIKI